METSNGWYQVRIELEKALDRVFDLKPEALFEFDSLLSIDEMNLLGFVRNFPHLTCVMCSIDEAQQSSFSKGEISLDKNFRQMGVDSALLPAACYKIYLGLRKQQLERSQVIGCIAKCFRRETKALDAYRAMNFTMKEFVCLGSSEDAQRHVETGLARIERAMEQLDIPFSCETASDPFFDSSGALATMSKLMPTKREIMFKGHAVASVNVHRNYFGDKFDIRFRDKPISTSCVAFGMERWLAMFRETFDTPQRTLQRLSAVS